MRAFPAGVKLRALVPRLLAPAGAATTTAGRERLFHVEPRLLVCPVCRRLQVPDPVVDEAAPLPVPTPRLCDKCRQRAGLAKLHQENALSRRRFLFLGAAAGVTLAVAPFLAVDWGANPSFTGPVGFGNRFLYARFIITPKMVKDCVLLGPGRFMQAAVEELAGMAEDVHRLDPRQFAVIKGIGG